ncbi:YcaO-like family protein [Altericista sp. CCNU0014]|uniref:YcaO-like family protein n=1 Tax=Altericista sp. CCNU0014 TaxID=3082949 RepID=UPI0038504C6D
MRQFSNSLPKLDLQGTIRAERAESTWQRLEPLLSVFEITRIANLTGLDCLGIPVAQAIRPNGCALTGSQGKGVSFLLAKVSAAMESIELYHAENLPEPEIVASYSALSRDRCCLDPQTLKPGRHWSRYHPDLPMGWVVGWDLFTKQAVCVPQAYLNLNTTVETPNTHLFSASSNGLASGNHLLEAIAHGLLETIERDSHWRWERSLLQRRIRCLVDPNSITAPLLRGFLDRIARAGATATIADITSRLGIPTYCCAISEFSSWQHANTAMGWGCHTSKEIALARAITEAAQSRLTAIAGSRDDILPECYGGGRRQPERHQPNPSPTTLSPVPLLDFEGQPELPPTSTFEENLQQILDCLHANGFERAVVVDHTRPEFGIPVIHTIVPGMQLPTH